MLRITEIRTQQNMSKYELAKKCGLSLTFISNIEAGEKSPTLRSLEKISAALNVSVTALIS